MSKLVLFLVTNLGLHSLALPDLAHSDEGSLPEIALSCASTLASMYFYYLIEVYMCFILK